MVSFWLWNILWKTKLLFRFLQIWFEPDLEVEWSSKWNQSSSPYDQWTYSCDFFFVDTTHVDIPICHVYQLPPSLLIVSYGRLVRAPRVPIYSWYLNSSRSCCYLPVSKSSAYNVTQPMSHNVPMQPVLLPQEPMQIWTGSLNRAVCRQISFK